MTSRDIHTGVSTSVAGFISANEGSELAQIIGRRIKRVKGLEKLLTCQSSQICYESICKFWENATLESDEIIKTKVNGTVLYVTEEVLRKTYDFDRFVGDNTQTRWKECRKEMWDWMVMDLIRNPVTKVTISVAEIHPEFAKLSKVISQNIMGNSGSLNTLSATKIEIMTAILYKLNFNFPRFIFVQMVETIKKEKLAAEKLSNKQGRWYGAKKPFGFIIQHLLDINEVTLIDPVNISGMKLKDGKAVESAPKRKRIDTVVQPTAEPEAVQKKKKSVVIVKPAEGHKTAESKAAEEPTRKKFVVSKLNAKKRKLVTEDSEETETEAELDQPLRAASKVVKAKTAKSAEKVVDEIQPAVKKLKHGKGKQLQNLSLEERKEAFSDVPEPTMPGEKEAIVEGESASKHISPAKTTTQTSMEQIYGDIISKDIEDISLPEAQAAEILTEFAETHSAEPVVEKVVEPELQISEPVTEKLAEVNVDETLVDKVVQSDVENVPTSLDAEEAQLDTTEAADDLSIITGRLSQWLNWKVSLASTQAETMELMIEEEKWALELLQLGSFAELVNTEELLKSCVSIVQRRRSKTPVTSEFHDSSSKDKDSDDSDSDDNPVDPSDKEASKVMDQQRAEMAGRFTGESSHSQFISEKGSEKTADVEDTVVFKTADVVLDAITSDLLKEIRSSEVITDADMQESITSDVSGSNYNSLDTLKEVLQIIKKTLNNTAEDVAPEKDVASKEAQTVDKATAGSQTAAFTASGKLFPDGIIRPTISTDDELVFSPTRSAHPDSESETAENVQAENVCRDVIAFQQPQRFNNAEPSTSAAQPDFNFLQQTLTTVMNSVLDIQRSVRKMEREAESTRAEMFSLERRMTSMDGQQYQFQLHMKNLSREVKDGFASVTAELQKPKVIKSKIDNLQEAQDGIIDALNSFTDATNTFRLENQGLSAVVHEDISDLRDNLDALIFDAANKGEILVIDPSAAQKLVMQKKLSRAVDSLKIAENGRVSLTEDLRLEFNDKWNEGRSLPFKGMDYVAALRTFLEFKVFEDRLKAWRTRRNEKMKRESGRVRLESAEELLQIFMDEYLSGLFGPETISIQKAWTYWKIYNPVTSFDSVEDKLQIFIAEQVADAAELEGQQNIS